MLGQPEHTVQLDQTRVLTFDANAITAFEREAKKHFLEFVSDIEESRTRAEKKHGKDKEATPITGKRNKEQEKKDNEEMLGYQRIEMIKSISMHDLSILVWAGIVEYDNNDNPNWPMSLNAVRRYVNLAWMRDNFMAVLNAMMAQTAPPKSDRSDRPTNPATEKSSTAKNGGPDFGPSPELIYDSLERKSAD